MDALLIVAFVLIMNYLFWPRCQHSDWRPSFPGRRLHRCNRVAFRRVEGLWCCPGHYAQRKRLEGRQ